VPFVKFYFEKVAQPTFNTKKGDGDTQTSNLLPTHATTWKLSVCSAIPSTQQQRRDVNNNNKNNLVRRRRDVNKRTLYQGMMADYTSPVHWAAASSKKPVEVVVGLSKSMGDMSGLNFALLTRYVVFWVHGDVISHLGDISFHFI
jgi:hypothetical protein